jgi:hypothetical protein
MSYTEQVWNARNTTSPLSGSLRNSGTANSKVGDSESFRNRIECRCGLSGLGRRTDRISRLTP